MGFCVHQGLDGERFLMTKKSAAETPPKIIVIINWIEELNEWMPLK